MVDHSSESLPEDVREAFHEAIRLYNEWRVAGGPPPPISFRKLPQVSLTGVCDLVLGYRNEPLPLKVHDELWLLFGKSQLDLKAELATDPSYATGARCLGKLIQEHRVTTRSGNAID
jgi:hypothetical protein